MNRLKVITADYEGKKRSLTVAEWAEVLGITKKLLYNRKTMGLSDQDTVDGRYKSKKKKIKVSERDLSVKYDQFNFSHGIMNIWRQKNGIR